MMQSVNLAALSCKKVRLRGGLEGVIKYANLTSVDARMPVYKVNLITSIGREYTTFYFQNGCCYNPNTSDLDMLYVIRNKRKSMEDL